MILFLNLDVKLTNKNCHTLFRLFAHFFRSDLFTRNSKANFQATVYVRVMQESIFECMQGYGNNEMNIISIIIRRKDPNHTLCTNINNRKHHFLKIVYDLNVQNKLTL